MPANPRTGRAAGCAFVDLGSRAEVSDAIWKLSGTKLLGRVVTIELARPPGQKKVRKTPGSETVTEAGGHDTIAAPNRSHHTLSTAQGDRSKEETISDPQCFNDTVLSVNFDSTTLHGPNSAAYGAALTEGRTVLLANLPRNITIEKVRRIMVGFNV
jgi:RNA recognition motif-containing protein